MEINIGDSFPLDTHCMGNRSGVRGVVVDEYMLGGRKGYQMVFPNCATDGFSNEEMVKFFDLDDRMENKHLSGYEFEDVIKLERDCLKGLFDKAFGVEQE